MRINVSVDEVYPYYIFEEGSAAGGVEAEYDVPQELWDEFVAARAAFDRAEGKLLKLCPVPL